jgi:putative DNA primase/helicase
LFRLIETDRPTLILDEYDTYLEDNHDLRCLLDGGHVINGRFIRCDGDDNNPRPFSTFCPKAIGGIGGVHATIASRAITIKLQRKPPSVKTEKLKFNCRDYLIETKQKAMRWAMDNVDALRSITPAMPQGLSDRSEDNWTPLCAIAELMGNGWVERAHAAAVALEDIGSAQSVHVKLLEDIRTVFGTRDKVSSQALAEDLARIETSPWPEYKNGKSITPRQIARLLAGFEIHPSSVRMPDGSTPKGYRIAQFEGAFKGYLQPVSNATTPQATDTNGSGPEAIRNGGPDVADRKQAEMADLLRGGVVADNNPETTGGTP